MREEGERFGAKFSYITAILNDMDGGALQKIMEKIKYIVVSFQKFNC
jgi:hypothetical protein